MKEIRVGLPDLNPGKSSIVKSMKVKPMLYDERNNLNLHKAGNITSVWQFKNLKG